MDHSSSLSDSPLHHDHHQLDYGDTIVPGSPLHMSQLSQESECLGPLNPRIATAVQSQRTHLSGSASVSEVSDTPGVSTTNDTMCNTDHVHDEGFDLPSRTPRDDNLNRFPHTDGASGQDLEDNHLQQEAYTSWNEFTYNVLSCFGSQFDTEIPQNNEDADEQDFFAPTSPANDPIPKNDSYLVDGDLSNFPGVAASAVDTLHLDRTQRSLRRGQTPNGAASEPGWPSNSGLAFFETTIPPILHYALPGIVVSDYTRPVGPDLFAPFHADPVTPAILVQQAYNISNALNSRWMSRLEPTQDLHRYCSMFPPQWLFDVGVRTLRNCYEGAFPCTFREIFALMHAAFAFSRVLANVGGFYNWEALSQDVCRWRYIIEDATEINIFVGVWQRTWSWQASMEMLVLENGFLSDILYSDCPFYRSDVDTKRHSLVPEASDDSNDHLIVSQCHKEIEKLLLRGMVFKECSRFLDAFRYGTITERNASWPVKSPWLDQAYLIDSVIEPLKKCRSANMLPQHIASTIKKLDNGVLHNLRELEVTLTASSEWSQIPHHIHGHYLDHVATQCNLAAKESETAWRNECYVDELNQVFELFARHTQQRDNAPDSFFLAEAINEPSTHILLGLMDNPVDLIIPDSGSRGATSAVPPIPPVGFGASPDYNHPSLGLPNVSLANHQDSRTVDPTSCSVTSSDFQSDGSPSSSQAISEPSSPTASSVTRCPRCSKSYQGTPSIQRRNLRRHLFEKHSLDPRLPCRVPGCRINFPAGRHDNRNRHLEQQHGWEFPPTTRMVQKRRRAT